MNEINEAAGSLIEIGANQHLDNYPITIKYQEGTLETTSLFNGNNSTPSMDGEVLFCFNIPL